MEEPEKQVEEDGKPEAASNITTEKETPPTKEAASQTSYNSEDEHIQQLQATGALKEVVGSQSILSQEICGLDASYGGDVGNNNAVNNDDNDNDDVNNSQEAEESEELTEEDMNGLGLSQCTVGTNEFSSQTMAQKYGLLSQDVAGANEEEDEPSPAKSTASSEADRHHLLNFSKFGSLLDAVHRREQEDNVKLVVENNSPPRKILSTCNIHFYDGAGDAMAEKTIAADDEEDMEDLQFSQFSQISQDSAIHKPIETGVAVLATDMETAALPMPIRIAMAAVGAPEKVVSSAAEVPKEKTAKKKSPPAKPESEKALKNDAATNKQTSNRAAASRPSLPVSTSRPSLPFTAIDQNHNGEKITNPHTLKRRRKAVEKAEQQVIAQRAAALAQQTITDPDLAKRLLLSMALVRENPRSAPSELPPRGATIPEGFFWAHYPPLEGVLKDHMSDYYELSITKCQSALQQEFNNKLVGHVRAEAKRQGWIFDKCFDDKTIRDRVRCYYKTHIQNAKKRLRTMVKNPTKRANARHLCAHLDLIQDLVPQEANNDDDGIAQASNDDKRKAEDAPGSGSPKRRETETGFVKGGEALSPVGVLS